MSLGFTSPTNSYNPDEGSFSFHSSGLNNISISSSSHSLSLTSSVVYEGTNNFNFAQALSDGAYDDLSITVTDAAGNSSSLAIPSFVIDTTEPDMQIVGDPVFQYYSNINEVWVNCGLDQSITPWMMTSIGPNTHVRIVFTVKDITNISLDGNATLKV